MSQKGWITSRLTEDQNSELDDLITMVIKRQGDVISRSRLKTFVADHGRNCGRRGYKTGHLAGTKSRSHRG